MKTRLESATLLLRARLQQTASLVQYPLGDVAIPHRYYNGPVEFRHLRYFIAVAERLNFSRAAQHLHIAQPPLSRQIRQLEDEIGTQLLERNPHGVKLTAAGAVFLEEARKLMLQSEHAVHAAKAAQKKPAQVVRIGIASGLGGAVSQVIDEHAQRHAAVELQCKDIFSGPQIEALLNHEIDVGFLRPPVDSAELDSEVLFEQEFVVVLPKRHPLAKRKSVRLKDLASEHLIIFERPLSSSLYDKILGLYRKQKLTPHLTVTHAETHEEAGKVMVASGQGIFIGVGAMVSTSLSGVDLAAVPLNEPGAKIEVLMAWRKSEKSTAVFNFLNRARRVFRRAKHKSL